MSNKNNDKNINAESHILNGLLGSIPAALVGGIGGAIASITAGFLFARNDIKKDIAKKNSWQIQQIQKGLDELKKHPYKLVDNYELLCRIYESLYPLFKDVKRRDCVCTSFYNYDRYSITTYDYGTIEGRYPHHAWEMMEEVDEILRDGYESIERYGGDVCIRKKNGELIIWCALPFKRKETNNGQ